MIRKERHENEAEDLERETIADVLRRNTQNKKQWREWRTLRKREGESKKNQRESERKWER